MEPLDAVNPFHGGDDDLVPRSNGAARGDRAALCKHGWVGVCTFVEREKQEMRTSLRRETGKCKKGLNHFGLNKKKNFIAAAVHF